jgi:hypothetical protein
MGALLERQVLPVLQAIEPFPRWLEPLLRDKTGLPTSTRRGMDARGATTLLLQ